MNNQYITVNLIPNLSAPAVACVSQYDVGRTLVFRVYNGVTSADLTGVTAVVVGTKKSGLGFSVTGTISGNAVTFSTTLEMTQESGMVPAEIRFSKTGEDIGTANFTLAVEPSPHLDGTTDGTTETMEDLQSQLDALDERVEALEGGGGGLTQAEKQLILTLFCKAAYAEDDAGVVYDALEALWATTTRTITYNLSHVSSSNTTASIEQGQSYATTLTASTNYTINSVSVTMGGVDITSTAYSSGTVSIPSVTGNIVITATAVLAAQSITATYTQSGTVYDTDSLDSLKADLVVTANYAGGTTETVPASNYTLSGTLTVGTSTITVSYAGLTDTFSVTVTAFGWTYSIDDLTKVTGSLGSKSTATCGMVLFRRITNGRSFVVGTGETSVALLNTNNDNIASQTSPYYPIKIPEGATSVTISIEPATQYVQILSRVLNDGVYSIFSTITGWSGYQESGGTKTFESAPDNAYIFVSTRYDADGTEYPVEPTALDITFS